MLKQKFINDKIYKFVVPYVSGVAEQLRHIFYKRHVFVAFNPKKCCAKNWSTPFPFHNIYMKTETPSLNWGGAIAINQ